MAEENVIGVLASLFLIIIVGWSMITVLQGADPENTVLFWFANRPELFLGVIIFLVFIGVILHIASEV